jgi:hypothetical protein
MNERVDRLIKKLLVRIPQQFTECRIYFFEIAIKTSYTQQVR